MVTGNLDRPGGASVSHQEFGERAGAFGYNSKRSRIGDFPDVFGSFPAALIADVITAAGEGGEFTRSSGTRCCRFPTSPNWIPRRRSWI